ncbi:MAG: 16S rRNA (guanine(966)-N(2))-methyltransferase RsmD [Alphaproteobacteria bacterium]
MRIIAGKYRGKKLFTPTTDTIRPTSDRARESIYNIINSKIDGDWEDISLLDVFSGTGAFSLEAVSRGVGEVGLIDLDITLSSKNATLFSAEKSKIKIIKANALNLPLSNKQYDIVFLDAPYFKDMSPKVLEELSTKGWLKSNALCIIELEKKEDLVLPKNFEELDERRYGLAKIIFATYHK